MKSTLIPVRVRQHLLREEGDASREQKLEHSTFMHQTVLLNEAVGLLEPKKDELVVDATAGSGGHTELLLESGAKVLALDADPLAVARVTEKLKRFATRLDVIEANFRDLGAILERANIAKVDKVLFDLGWNREQLAGGKGFSFLRDEPLNMSYGQMPASGFTAECMLNEWSEEVLANIIFGYGEERYARRIAKAIVERRAKQKISSTLELAEIVKDAVPAGYRRGKAHPATKTFQALRIAVNDELKSIELGVEAAWEHLSCGGRIAVISFHSIEDRVVKHLFAAYAKESGKLIVKKPLVPERSEIVTNPSSRSAKLRVIEKICTE